MNFAAAVHLALVSSPPLDAAWLLAAWGRDREHWNEPQWLLIAFVGLAFALAMVSEFIDRLCPPCRRYWALKKTGKTSGSTKEWQCKHCGYVRWRRKIRGSGGSGGGGDG